MSDPDDYLKTWEDFWAPIIAPEGELSLDKVKRELHDFRVLMGNVSKVYMDLTGGRVSKQLTDPGVVMELAEENMNRQVARALRDMAEEWEP